MRHRSHDITKGRIELRWLERAECRSRREQYETLLRHDLVVLRTARFMAEKAGTWHRPQGHSAQDPELRQYDFVQVVNKILTPGGLNSPLERIGTSSWPSPPPASAHEAIGEPPRHRARSTGRADRARNLPEPHPRTVGPGDRRTSRPRSHHIPLPLAGAGIAWPSLHP
jgi:hypothetical protein